MTVLLMNFEMSMCCPFRGPRFPPPRDDPPRDALNVRPRGGLEENDLGAECELDVPPERGRDDELPPVELPNSRLGRRLPGLEDELE